MTTYTQADLDNLMADRRTKAVLTIRFLRPLAGGQPAGDAGLRAFVQHQMGIAPDSPEFENAVARINGEEINVTPDGGEVNEEQVYGVNVIRSTAHGPYIAEHQIKALLKQAASRMGLFAAKGKIGSKGDLAEMGTISAAGDSLIDLVRPWEIYLRKDGQPAQTQYDVIQGRVSTPQGQKSIQHHTEVAEEGCEATVEIDWPANKLKAADMALVIAAASKIGLGSCLSLGYGRFEVVSLDID